LRRHAACGSPRLAAFRTPRAVESRSFVGASITRAVRLAFSLARYLCALMKSTKLSTSMGASIPSYRGIELG
jgi:hypothetical protein